MSLRSRAFSCILAANQEGDDEFDLEEAMRAKEKPTGRRRGDAVA